MIDSTSSIAAAAAAVELSLKHTCCCFCEEEEDREEHTHIFDFDVDAVAVVAQSSKYTFSKLKSSPELDFSHAALEAAAAATTDGRPSSGRANRREISAAVRFLTENVRECLLDDSHSQRPRE